MKLVFFGTPEFAVPTLDALYKSEHEILGVVTSSDKKSGRGLKIKSSAIKEFSEKYNLPLYQPKNTNCKILYSTLEGIDPDLYVIVAYKILPESIINIPRKGAINLHASLLPKYRGAAPVNHAILNGDTEIGLSTFLIQKQVDTGDLLYQETMQIDNSITAGEALSKLSYIGANLMLKTLSAFTDNNIKPIKQDSNIATYAPKISINDCKINWNNTANTIHNQIRAYTPKPGAFTYYYNKRVKLFGSRILPKINVFKSLTSGQIDYFDSKFIIGTGSVPIQISHIQIEGKKILPANQFILGHPTITGSYFG